MGGSWSHLDFLWEIVPKFWHWLVDYIICSHIDMYNNCVPAFFSGKAFSYFASQDLWAHEVSYHPVTTDSELCFVKTECVPLQRVNAIPHTVWVCLYKKTGVIARAYCSRFAELGATCNHIAALLFKLDHT